MNILNPEDISLGQSVFYPVPQNCTLYVPKGSKTLYEAADQWKDFTNIKEIDINSGIIFIDATPDNQTSNIENENVYNLAGQKVSRDYKGIVVKNGKKYRIK